METRPEFDDYDPRAWLERSGLLFLHHSRFVAATSSFSRLIGMEPAYAMAWYGLGNALICLSGQRADIALLCEAVSSLKRAAEIDPNSKLPNVLLDAIPHRTPLSQDQVADTNAATTVPMDLSTRIGFTDSTFADSMAAMERPAERMQVVMWLGTLDEPCGKEILLAALDDSDSDVRMAALKRLRAADDDSRVAAKIQQLAFSDEGKSSEPYLSMALNRFASAAADSSHWAARVLSAIDDDGQ